jgi:hypothetical protein
MARWYSKLFSAADGVAPATDPRKRVTGTSYNASGSLPVDAGALTESGSSRGGLSRELVPTLGNRSQAVRKYDEMSSNDSAVDISLRAAKMPVMAAMYFVEPFDDSPEALDIAEFVEFNLLNGTSAPFLLILEDILRMYEYGFSVVEKVYENREWSPRRTGANRRKYTMLKKLAPRPTPTIGEIKYDDNGGPLTVDQMAVKADGKPVKTTIPIEKLVIFSFNKKGGNLEGKSLLRTAYKHWYYKENLYKIDGIQKERHGMGFPVIQLPVGYKPADIVAANELVQNIRTNEKGGAVLPPNFMLSFLELPGQPVDVLRSIEHHNGMIMLNTMTQFLLLGLEGTGGGRATSGSHQDMFTKANRYAAQLICDELNFYLIPQLVAYNFQTDKLPRLAVRNIGETKDLQQWASAIANLIANNAITPDIETEQWVRSIIDSPLKRGKVQTPIDTTSQKGQLGKGNNQEQAPGTAPTDQAGQ